MLINKELIDSIRPEIDAALNAVAKKYGIKIETAGAAYDAEGLTGEFKLELEVLTTENGESVEEALFNRDCEQHNLKPSDYKKHFYYHGEEYYLCGFQPRARKDPLLVVNVETGQSYRMAVNLFQSLIALKIISENTQTDSIA